MYKIEQYKRIEINEIVKEGGVLEERIVLKKLEYLETLSSEFSTEQEGLKHIDLLYSELPEGHVLAYKLI